MYKLRLADCELDIMEILWELGLEMTTAQVKAKLEQRKKRVYGRTTVANWLARLRKSHNVECVKRDGTVYYYPLVSRADYEAREMRFFAERLFDGSYANVIRAFLQAEDLTEEDKQEIREIIEKTKIAQ